MNDGQPPDRSAWIHEALERFEGPLLRYAASITTDADRARDLVQDTFLRLCRENPADLNGRLGPWLFAVCRNLAFDERRKNERMQTLMEASNATHAGQRVDPACAVEMCESEHRMLGLLAELPDNQQDVIRLRFQGGLSYKDIASVTGLSVTNVGYLIHTAIGSLREKMEW